ncbi:hypothetical protein QC761_300930 [Podospora bellae-mahoneyi]|uniref:T6SS Phospholipase effector Tle1-like catalytic domain-containing protein n=1 Tax=Podospora bellae-mahoneyi TaxID=2093777 RepID=A0ABR0FKN2_9PEZI|nr:hypothetical protein QC761_300930 [Podospora bellae-mahoneyi]
MGGFMPFFPSGSDFRQSGFKDATLKPAAKRIIICCDGTWQSSVTNTVNIPSNITRIARYLSKVGRDGDDPAKEWQQVVYYDAGIGTAVGVLESARQGNTGSGFVGNVIEAYNFIVNNYTLGDQIFCLGFSRGAYTARAVAGLVTDIGVIQPRDMQDFAELYNVYQAHSDNILFRQSKAWREWVEGKRLFDPNQKGSPKGWKQAPSAWEKKPHGAPPEATRWVEAVAVFDTVGCLGIPEFEGYIMGGLAWLLSWAVTVEKFGFHNVTLSPYIKHAYQALALDEHRKPFDAAVWHLPAPPVRPAAGSNVADLRQAWEELRDTDGATEDQLTEAWENLVAAEMFEELGKRDAEPKLLQVWFPGVHVNMGGGSKEALEQRRGDFEQIAMITLMWMVEQLTPHLHFDNNAFEMLTDRFMVIQPIIDDLITSKKQDHWLIKKINALKARDNAKNGIDSGLTWARNLAAEALMGWATGPIVDTFEGGWIKKATGSKYRTPGEYKESQKGRTNEEIHPTVRYRMDRLSAEGVGYDPVPLKDFTRQKTVVSQTQADGSIKEVVGYEWVKNNVRIPEYKIAGPFDKEGANFERACVVTESASEWLGKLDKELGIDSWEARGLDKS